jgi:hypothetical protein
LAGRMKMPSTRVWRHLHSRAYVVRRRSLVTPHALPGSKSHLNRVSDRGWRSSQTGDESWLYFTNNPTYGWVTTRPRETTTSPKRMPTIFWPLGFPPVEFLSVIQAFSCSKTIRFFSQEKKNQKTTEIHSREITVNSGSNCQRSLLRGEARRGRSPRTSRSIRCCGLPVDRWSIYDGRIRCFSLDEGAAPPPPSKSKCLTAVIASGSTWQIREWCSCE